MLGISRAGQMTNRRRARVMRVRGSGIMTLPVCCNVGQITGNEIGLFAQSLMLDFTSSELCILDLCDPFGTSLYCIRDDRLVWQATVGDDTCQCCVYTSLSISGR